jgi:DNA primase
MSELKPIMIRGAVLDPFERCSLYSKSRICLCQMEEGRPGREYLLWKRFLDWSTISKFRLGFIPADFDSAFAGRVIMPIFDAYDDLIAVSARPIISDEKKLKEIGKYWNESFPKGEHLFGLNVAKYSIAKLNFAIVVEGQMDVYAMHSYGFSNTVGILGGGFTPFHALQLMRYCNQVVIIMDGDKAGAKHAERTRETLSIFKARSTSSKLPRSTLTALMATTVDLSNGGAKDDPDSFLAKRGSYILKKMIDEAVAMAGISIPQNWLNA